MWQRLVLVYLRIDKCKTKEWCKSIRQLVRTASSKSGCRTTTGKLRLCRPDQASKLASGQQGTTERKRTHKALLKIGYWDLCLDQWISIARRCLRSWPSVKRNMHSIWDQCLPLFCQCIELWLISGTYFPALCNMNSISNRGRLRRKTTENGKEGSWRPQRSSHRWGRLSRLCLTSRRNRNWKEAISCPQSKIAICNAYNVYTKQRFQAPADSVRHKRPCSMSTASTYLHTSLDKCYWSKAYWSTNICCSLPSFFQSSARLVHKR